MDVEHAVQFVMACTTSYRLPEPTRWAHKVAGGETLPDAANDQLTLF
jgi:deoxyinosine 3'endonuclease (endonuclease V)